MATENSVGGRSWTCISMTQTMSVYLFGVPEAVTSAGYDLGTGGIDHVTTLYHYPDVPHVVAEGGLEYE